MKNYNIGLIGAGFMAKAHSLAYATMPMFFWPAPGIPIRKSICDVSIDIAKDAAQKMGYEKFTDSWKDIVSDPDIDIVDICTPNNIHAEIAIAAAKNGKHVFCEKPIAMTAQEAKDMLDAVQKAGVKHMLAFNYRRTPAVALAKDIITKGEIGEIQSFRGMYFQDWSASPESTLSWRFQKEICGTGALGDIGTHVIDMAQYLVGDIDMVSGFLKTYIKERPLQEAGQDKLGALQGGNKTGAVTVDDETAFSMRFKNGALGHIEASRNAWGRNNYIAFEIHGSAGSIFFNYERRDELQLCYATDPQDRRGFKTIYTGPNHAYGELWPIAALGIGYSETKIAECYDLIKAIAQDEEATPNFNEGYKIALVCDAVVKSDKQNGAWIFTGV
ncbi:MAG: Gfo/Idh/MocA family oxidoreductase [Defluviitaleaceae bacterium]|nr:Gfo/Idh/MocA family oxidoreductase [Defluviitaleaceae bacterium]